MACIVARGTTFSWDGNEVAGVVDIGGPSPSAPTVDCTDLSDTDASKVQAAIRDGGEFPVQCNFDQTDANGQIQMISDSAGLLTSKPWVITWNDGNVTPGTVAGNGFVVGYEFGNITLDGKIEITFTVSVDGSVTVTPGTP
ncbi:MAG: hypothetical protein GTO41_20015 [Burkholderiales bacterium]|nr:hypothetical protein [Burkholderiales bacterium]